MRRIITGLMGISRHYAGSLYYTLRDTYDSPAAYRHIETDARSKLALQAVARPFLVDDKPFYQVRRKDLKKLWGRPVYDIRPASSPNTEILFYRQLLLDQYRTRIEFHLHRDKLFFCCYQFPYLTREEQKRDILKSLIEKKYLGGQIFDPRQHVVTIPDDCMIMAGNSLIFQIYFFVPGIEKLFQPMG